jgi:hypothetical protein
MPKWRVGVALGATGPGFFGTGVGGGGGIGTIGKLEVGGLNAVVCRARL